MTLCSIFVGDDMIKIDQTLTSPAWLSPGKRGEEERERERERKREKERGICVHGVSRAKLHVR